MSNTSSAQLLLSNSVVHAPRGLFLAFLTLGLGGLFIGTGEFASMSLLPWLAAETEVSLPVAGGYVSAYALGVVVGAPILAVLLAQWDRRRALKILMAIFIMGYGASALATSHKTLFIARFVSGLPHGAYYGLASLVAASMVAPNRKAQAASYVMLGLAAANAIGVPVATWAGQTLGWRFAFGSIAAGGLLTLCAVAMLTPTIRPEHNTNPRRELSAMTRSQVWMTVAVASVGFAGMFCVYSYITPTLTEVTRMLPQQVPLVLSLMGVGMIAGNLVGGWLVDQNSRLAIIGILAWNALSLSAFSMLSKSPAGTLTALIFIGCGFALVPALQARLMHVAGEAQTLAAALNHCAFNISNALGATLGGWGIALGLGWEATGYIGAGLAMLGLFIFFGAVCLETTAQPTQKPDYDSTKTINLN